MTTISKSQSLTSDNQQITVSHFGKQCAECGVVKEFGKDFHKTQLGRGGRCLACKGGIRKKNLEPQQPLSGIIFTNADPRYAGRFDDKQGGDTILWSVLAAKPLSYRPPSCPAVQRRGEIPRAHTVSERSTLLPKDANENIGKQPFANLVFASNSSSCSATSRAVSILVGCWPLFCLYVRVCEVREKIYLCACVCVWKIECGGLQFDSSQKTRSVGKIMRVWQRNEVHVNTRSYVNTYPYVYVFICTYIHTHTYLCMCIYIQIYAFSHICIWKHHN